MNEKFMPKSWLDNLDLPHGPLIGTQRQCLVGDGDEVME
jgi:hypothetical protein